MMNDVRNSGKPGPYVQAAQCALQAMQPGIDDNAGICVQVEMITGCLNELYASVEQLEDRLGPVLACRGPDGNVGGEICDDSQLQKMLRELRGRIVAINNKVSEIRERVRL